MKTLIPSTSAVPLVAALLGLLALGGGLGAWPLAHAENASLAQQPEAGQPPADAASTATDEPQSDTPDAEPAAEEAEPLQPWQVGQGAPQYAAQPLGARPTGDPLLPISEVQYGAFWPFTQPQAELACTPSGAELVRFGEDAVYSLSWPREGYALLPSDERRMDATGTQPRSIYPVLRDAINHCCVLQGMPAEEDEGQDQQDQQEKDADGAQPAVPLARQACYSQWDIAHAKGWAALGVNPMGGVFDAVHTHAFSYQSWPFIRVVERAAYAWPFKWRDFYLTCTEQGAVVLGTRIDWRLGHVQQGGGLKVVWLGGADLPEALQPHAVPLRHIVQRGAHVGALQQALLSVGQHFCPRVLPTAVTPPAVTPTAAAEQTSTAPTTEKEINTHD